MKRDQALQLFEPFENILFDFGGIFLNLDFQKSVDAFTELGSTVPFDQLFSKHAQTSIFNLFETGKLSPTEFIAELKKILNLPNVSDEKIIAAWCAMLLDVPHERVEFLLELKKTKKIYMLSNINQIHEDRLKEYFDGHETLGEFYSHFDRVFFSHQIGLRKPNRDVFEYVCREAKLDPRKTIFIDDSIQHIEGAKAFGLATFHLNPSNTFMVTE